MEIVCVLKLPSGTIRAYLPMFQLILAHHELYLDVSQAFFLLLHVPAASPASLPLPQPTPSLMTVPRLLLASTAEPGKPLVPWAVLRDPARPLIVWRHRP